MVSTLFNKENYKFSIGLSHFDYDFEDTADEH